MRRMNPSGAIYYTNQAPLDQARCRGMGSSTGIRGATLQRSSPRPPDLSRPRAAADTQVGDNVSLLSRL